MLRSGWCGPQHPHASSVGVSDAALLRPTEITVLQGDYSLAEKELGWRPRTSFEQLMALMVDSDLARFQ